MQWLLYLLSRLGNLAKVLWLCGYATAFILGGIAFFVVSAQGADFLRLLSEQRPLSFGTWPRTAFYVGVVLWSLASWYSSRLLAIRQLPGFNLPSQASEAYRIWVPRVLGALPPAVVAAGFFRVSLSGGAGDLILPLRWQGFWFAVLAIVMFVFYWRRRELFPSLVYTPAPGAQLAALPPQSVWIVAAAIVASYVLLFLFILSPVAVPRFLGAPAIFVLASTSLVLFGSIVLTYMPLMWGYSGLTLPVVLYALLISGTNDNHRVREATPLPGQMDLADRSTAPKHFREWLASVEAETSASAEPSAAAKGSDAAVCGGPSAEGYTSAGDDRYPVFVVATAGGGIRAAYWTAVVLGTIADCIGMDTWRRHLYAVSGVSGGSLGAVVHAAEVVDSQPGARADAAARARRALEDDHLSPVTAFLLFPDLLQRFLPHGFAALDRARALEESWEASADASLGRGSLSRPFLALWPKTRIHSLPSLLINSTRVETGQRAVISNLDLTEGFPDVVDLLGTETGATPQDSYQLERLANIPVSTAAHLSARFTYVSPAARIERDKPRRALWGRLVDGGYFDNSGAATASDLLDAIRTSDSGPSTPVGPSPGKRPVFLILIIKNDPHAPSALATSVREPLQPPPRFFSEVTAPVQALLEARDARGMLAEQNFVSSVEAINADPQLARSQCVVEFTLAPLEIPVAKKDVEVRTAKFDDPPLGWSLSKLSIDAMEARLIEQADQFRRVRESIRLGTCVGWSPAS
jgi:hypothetical protein